MKLQPSRKQLLPAVVLAACVSVAFAQKPAQTPPPQTPPTPAPATPQSPAPATTSTVQLPTTLPGTPQATPPVPSPRAFATIIKDTVEMNGFFNSYSGRGREMITALMGAQSSLVELRRRSDNRLQFASIAQMGHFCGSAYRSVITG